MFISELIYFVCLLFKEALNYGILTIKNSFLTAKLNLFPYYFIEIYIQKNVIRKCNQSIKITNISSKMLANLKVLKITFQTATKFEKY